MPGTQGLVEVEQGEGEHQARVERRSMTQVYPGEDVTLTVTAEADSLCALSATDKSVDLLGNKNKVKN